MKKFALIGAAGYVAPLHMKAIKETGNQLVAALDPFDSVGILDSYFPETDFFTEFERFDRHLEKLKRRGTPIDYISICSPNYLHDAHVRFGLRLGASVICEKPLVLNPWNVAALEDIEKEYPGSVNNILQLRLHPSVIELRKMVKENGKKKVYDINLEYITTRGKWYHISWKGDVSKSGGIVTNIGIHFFDMLLWIFGEVLENEVFTHNSHTASGYLRLEMARVNWKLSISPDQLPKAIRKKGDKTYRCLSIENKIFEFSGGFKDLHTLSYQKILSEEGFMIKDTQKAIELVYSIRNQLSR